MDEGADDTMCEGWRGGSGEEVEQRGRRAATNLMPKEPALHSRTIGQRIN